MTVKTSIWRVEGSKPIPVVNAPLDLEGRLEDLIVAAPDLLGPDQLLIIDRQVYTSHGKYLDVLAVDEEARLHAIELKKDKTPRDVVAQALDYGWSPQVPFHASSGVAVVVATRPHARRRP